MVWNDRGEMVETEFHGREEVRGFRSRWCG